ncbi:MAG: tRNA (adenine(22)-N(1))-methyltransferase TrmK, partial [Clostridia bacterium]
VVTPTELSRARADRLRTMLARPDVRVLEGYGFRPLQARVLDLVIVAGVGGGTLARILTDHAAHSSWPLLLQPMQNLGALLRALRAVNRGVDCARLVESRGRLYPILDIPINLPWSGGPPGFEDDLGLFLQGDPLWPAWLDDVARRRSRQLHHVSSSDLVGRLEQELAAIRSMRAAGARRHPPELPKISR